jgi:hypothetical protein
MPESQLPRSKVLRRILEEDGDHSEDHEHFYASEWQHAAQAFNLHVEKRDGMHSEGFPWAQYAGCKWSNEGDHERLVILFGARALEIEGHNLRDLVNEIREGKLNRVTEMVTSQAALKEANADTDPIIREIRMYPDFEEILKDIKGENRREARIAE